jgi:hypothetical protein
MRVFWGKGVHENLERKLRVSRRWEEPPGKCSCRLEMKHLKRQMYFCESLVFFFKPYLGFWLIRVRVRV